MRPNSRAVIAAVLACLGGAGLPVAQADSPVYGGLGCGMTTVSDYVNDPARQIGSLVGGPFVIPDASDVTVRCTASVGNDVIGDQAGLLEVTLEATTSGSVGDLSGPIQLYVPNGSPIYVCTEVDWTDSAGVTESMYFGCSAATRTAGTDVNPPNEESAGTNVKAQDSHDRTTRKRKPPEPECTAPHGDLGPPDVSPADSFGPYTWYVSVTHVEAGSAGCTGGTTVDVTIRDSTEDPSSSEDPVLWKPYSAAEPTKSGGLSVPDFTAHGPTVPYLTAPPRVKANLVITMVISSSKLGEDSVECRTEATYEVLYSTVTKPQVSAGAEAPSCS